MSRVALAKTLGVSRQTLYDITDARQRVTTRMAVRLARVFGTSPESWLQMQANYDLWVARRTVDVSTLRRLA